jgi:hypothetical protein
MVKIIPNTLSGVVPEMTNISLEGRKQILYQRGLYLGAELEVRQSSQLFSTDRAQKADVASYAAPPPPLAALAVQ